METLLLAKKSIAQGEMTLPGSKSISNRALLLASLCGETTFLKGLLESDDVHYMKEALKQLGITLHEESATECYVKGNEKGYPNKNTELFLGNAGTAFRPLTAALAMSHGHYILKGVDRMHERPIKDLVDALSALGLKIEYLDKTGYPPLEIFPACIHTNEISVKGDVSSQFLTALLLSLPMTKQPIKINVEGTLISKPYIAITSSLLKDFGIEVINHDWCSFEIKGDQTYRSPKMYYVEGDASSASYFLAMGAIAGDVTVHGIGKKSIQGDIQFIDVLEKMGAEITWSDHSVRVQSPKDGLKGVDLDCNHIPDAAMTLAIVALYAEGKTVLRNIASWRVKETDRIAAMATELRKLGVTVEEGEDFIVVHPTQHLNENVSIYTYDDHRIAMCFSLCAFKTNIIIEDPKCVNKTFPNYFDTFNTIVKS